VSSALPSDLLDAVRVRVGRLALLLFAAFAFDPIIFFGTWTVATAVGHSLPDEFFATASFLWFSVCAAGGSAAIWWLARDQRVSLSKLHSLALAYEVAVCFVIAISAQWQHYLDTGLLPNLTWTPVVIILFPLVVPGPPGRMLAAAVTAGAMSPLALLLLDLSGRVVATPDAYFRATFSSAVAVGFAYWSARVVYGLGRELVAARELGSYRLERRLGEGGMGEVWLARHRLLARPAAIKVIRPLSPDQIAGTDEARRRRFEREAQVIASLRSPHTVELFDFGIAHDGSFYYVMELLDGLDADRFVRRFGPLPAERVVHLLTQVCHSLSEAESLGLVHRDIKPANVFLCRYGEDCDFVKVLDFGLVKALSHGDDARPGLTREHTVHGTPAFMAPEQALGQPMVDSRADIYATGCLAYWLLTGELVFEADTPMAFLLHHAHTPPLAPSARTELPIPPSLDRLVLSCLAKDPAERPQSARILSRHLAQIDITHEWTVEHARTWWADHGPMPGETAAPA